MSDAHTDEGVPWALIKAIIDHTGSTRVRHIIIDPVKVTITSYRTGEDNGFLVSRDEIGTLSDVLTQTIEYGIYGYEDDVKDEPAKDVVADILDVSNATFCAMMGCPSARTKKVSTLTTEWQVCDEHALDRADFYRHAGVQYIVTDL